MDPLFKDFSLNFTPYFDENKGEFVWPWKSTAIFETKFLPTKSSPIFKFKGYKCSGSYL